jgi:hypothetical protein
VSSCFMTILITMWLVLSRKHHASRAGESYATPSKTWTCQRWSLQPNKDFNAAMVLAVPKKFLHRGPPTGASMERPPHCKWGLFFKSLPICTKQSPNWFHLNMSHTFNNINVLFLPTTQN